MADPEPDANLSPLRLFPSPPSSSPTALSLSLSLSPPQEEIHSSLTRLRVAAFGDAHRRRIRPAFPPPLLSPAAPLLGKIRRRFHVEHRRAVAGEGGGRGGGGARAVPGR